MQAPDYLRKTREKEVPMSQRAKDLSRRIQSFSNEIIAFVENMDDKDWSKTTEWEQWPVGTAARHLGTHFAITQLAEMMIKGEDLPQMTMEQINAMSEKDAREHLDCTKAEALDQLREKSAGMVTFVSGLSDEALDCKGRMQALGGEVTVEQLLDFILFQSGGQHLASIRKAVAGS